MRCINVIVHCSLCIICIGQNVSMYIWNVDEFAACRPQRNRFKCDRWGLSLSVCHTARSCHLRVRCQPAVSCSLSRCRTQLYCKFTPYSFMLRAHNDTTLKAQTSHRHRQRHRMRMLVLADANPIDCVNDLLIVTVREAHT